MSTPLVLPPHYNYVGVFLTLACNLKCTYCINNSSGVVQKKGHLSGEEWVSHLNRLQLPTDIPITLQGGEPSIHPHFYKIINGIRNDLSIDLLTNLQFDVLEFAKNIAPDRLKRRSEYASIRVTYHPETMEWAPLIRKVKWMQQEGYDICVYGILHPRDEAEIFRAQASASEQGVKFKTKEFLGQYNGNIYGNYRYPQAVFGKKTSTCFCKTSELLIGAEGNAYRCHHDLYNQINPQGNISHMDFSINDIFKICQFLGRCNPCDIKIKTNRHQQWGHTSVEIKDILGE